MVIELPSLLKRSC